MHMDIDNRSWYIYNTCVYGYVFPPTKHCIAWKNISHSLKICIIKMIIMLVADGTLLG